jgi:CTP synthase (UTP-ammonia lyase)
MGLADAQSVEENLASEHYLIVPVSCPVPNRAGEAPKLSGKCRIRLYPGTRIHAILGREEIHEEHFCNYELNPAFQEQFVAAGLKITGEDDNGVARAVELPGHRFFLATLFQPQLSSEAERPHPLIIAFLEAARAFQQGRAAAQSA